MHRSIKIFTVCHTVPERIYQSGSQQKKRGCPAKNRAVVLLNHACDARLCVADRHHTVAYRQIADNQVQKEKNGQTQTDTDTEMRERGEREKRDKVLSETTNETQFF